MCTNVQNSQDKEQRERGEKRKLFQSQSESVKQKWKKITLYQQEYALACDNNNIILCHNQPTVYE